MNEHIWIRRRVHHSFDTHVFAFSVALLATALLAIVQLVLSGGGQ